jgi:hypothetical protein
MPFLKYILELVVLYYIAKFLFSLIGTFFGVKRVMQNANAQQQMPNNGNTMQANQSSKQAKPPLNIKDGDYIDYEEVNK